MAIKQHIPVIGITLLILLSLTAAFYKFAYLKDYTTVFHQECDPQTEQCFAYLDECEEGVPEEECGYFYKIALVSGHKNINCENDDGTCLENFCSLHSQSCVSYTCNEEDDFSVIGVYDGCYTQ